MCIYMITLDEIKGEFSSLAVIVRTSGLLLFKFLHPFPASILNEYIDFLDTPLSPKISDEILRNNPNYQIPDKILDFILYGFWLLIPIIQKKWFTPILVAAMIFRSVGLYQYLTTRDEDYLTKYPNVFIYWYFLFYGLEYFDTHVSKVVLLSLIAMCYILKSIHEDILRGKYVYLLEHISNKRKELQQGVSDLVYYVLIILVCFILFWKVLPSKHLYKPAI
jgi:hypothetical protein